MNRRQFLMAAPGGIALAQTNGGRQGVALGFLLVSAAGATNVAPDGKQLWQHPWRGFPIVQPAVTSDGDVLIAAAADSGTRRIRIAHGAEGWTVEKRWGSDALKPYFNDSSCTRGTRMASTAGSSRASTSRMGGASGRADATATASSSCCPNRTCCWCCRRMASWRW